MTRAGSSCEAAFSSSGAMRARVVPGAIARRGAYIGKDVVLMPSFVNIGAHVGVGVAARPYAGREARVSTPGWTSRAPTSPC